MRCRVTENYLVVARAATPALFILIAVLGGAGCGEREGGRAATVQQSVTSGTPHEQYAAAGFSCADCHACGAAASHPASWMDQASPGFHAASANAGLAACQTCHGATLAGGSAPVSCAACHGAGWTTNCVMCHGGTDGPSGAPPRATWGNGADAVRIGAHTAHLSGSSRAPAVECVQCHQKPADALSPGHVDGPTATVAFGDLAAKGAQPAWNRASATCSGTYCHGATLGGGSNKTPVWTGGAGQAACGTCHGVPPPAPHPAVAAGVTGCSTCHPATVDATGTLIPPAAGGKHLDGVIQSTSLHPASWTDTASPGFHAYSANAGLGACQSCHGADLAGGSAGVSCAQCHGADWKTNCVTCHGGTNNQTGAPPRTTWGNGADAVRIGAHTAHLSGSNRAPAVECVQCHQKPADALSPGHVDGPTASIAFGDLAAQGAQPAWNRSSATCSGTYCHGATLGGGSNNTPVWTGGAGQAACGTCHGVPPPSPHPAVAAGVTGCSTCHPATIDATGTLIPPSAGGKHLDGVLEVTSGHPASWTDTTSPGFHAFSANAGLGACQSCHGADLAGGSAGVSCAQCHGANWRTNCVECHGGTNNQTGAPPRTTWGNGADAVRIGAHTSHVGATHGLSRAADCSVCHVKPQEALSPGHIDGPTATVAFVGSTPSWDRGTATCSGSYCHGATLAGGGTRKSPRWTSADGLDRTCDACHGAPPATSHHTRTDLDCSACHGAGYSAVNRTVVQATHIDGKVDTTLTCTSCHGTSARGGAIAAAPPLGTRGETATTTRAVGAHLQHLQGGTLAAPTACTECHAVPTSAVHSDGVAALTWGTLAKKGALSPAWNPTTLTCSANWCHGGKLTGGSRTTPIWTTVNGSQDACGTCHGLPPTSGRHGQSEHRVSCDYCHATGYSATTVNTSLHVNGVIEVQGSRIRTWNAATRSCQPTCHGTQSWGGTALLSLTGGL